ncbi:MAG: hypothetical protein M3271_02140, partial [Actinomycetota bacterium]|nr:hypothetical protein [Actinomycetota bacterium]
HYMFLLVLAVQAVFVVSRVRSGFRADAKTILPVGGALALFLLPAVPTLLRLVGDRQLLSNPYRSSPGDVFTFLLPPSLLYPLVLTLAAGAVLVGMRLHRSGYVTGAIPFLVAWAAVPALVLYEVSKRTPTNVFVPRYALMVIPALALLIGMAIRQLRHAAVQLAVVLVMAVVAVRTFQTTTHTSEDWRAAAAAQRAVVDDPDTPVLLFSGFIEANQMDWLADPERADYLSAPAAMYPMEGRLIPTPFNLTGAGTAYMQDITEDVLLPSEEFVLVTRGGEPYRAWLDPQTAQHGFVANLVGAFGDVWVYEFTRGPASAGAR